MKKIFYLLIAILLLSGSANAKVTSAKNPDFSFDFAIQSNMDYQSLTPASATVAYSVRYDGKVENIKFLSFGGEDFDLAVWKAFNKLGYIDNQAVDSAMKTKKYIGNEISRFVVNMIEKNAISKGDVDKMIINKNTFYVTEITDSSNTVYNTNPVNANNEVLNEYIKTIDKESDEINKNLTPWNSFKTKTIQAYVKINRDGSVGDAILLQSCGSDEYDSYYLEKIKNHVFSAPDKSIADKDLGFIFTAKPVKQEKYNALNSYRRSVERLLYYETPSSASLKPTTISLLVTISKNGRLTSVKLLDNTYSQSYDKKLIEAYKKVVFKPIPKDVDLDSLTMVVRIRKNVQFYPLLDDRNYTSWIVLD